MILRDRSEKCSWWWNILIELCMHPVLISNLDLVNPPRKPKLNKDNHKIRINRVHLCGVMGTDTAALLQYQTPLLQTFTRV